MYYIDHISSSEIKQNEVSEVIRYLKEHGTDLNRVDDQGMTLLMQSCNYQPVIFKELVEQGVDIHQETALSTPLAYCASKAYAHGTGPQNIQLLIERGAEVNVSDTQGVPAIVNIAQKAPKQVNAMLKAGADPNAADRKGNTPLMVTQSYNAAKALVEAGANVNAIRGDGTSILAIHTGAEDNARRDDGIMSEAVEKSFWNQGDYNIAKLLIDSGAKPDGKTLQYTRNPRIVSVLMGTRNDVWLSDEQIQSSPNLTAEMVKKYMEKGGKQSVIDEALREACFWGNGAKITALAKGGANPNTRHHYENKTPLMMAVEEMQPQASVTLESIQALLDAGANINDTDENGDTALMAACVNSRPKGDRTKIIQLLLDSGADVKMRNKSGQNVLFWISNGGVTPEMIHEMIKRGANPNLTDEDGNTPLNKCWNDASCKALVDAGAQINAQNKEGENALIHAITHAYGAAEEKLPSVCDALIAAGIDLKATDKKG